MYNTNVVCTYNTPEVFIESDNITDDERAFVRETIYRQELLDIFGLEEFNDHKIDNAIYLLYEKLKYSEEMRKCMLKFAEMALIIEEKIGLMVLFSYDYMYLTHICVSEYIETGKITELNISNLLAKTT